MKRNINLLFVIKAAKWLMLYMPISFLFYKENNFSTGEYWMLHAIYSGVIAILEVPSGYFADVIGRKPSMVFGTLFGVIGFGVYSFTYGFTGFLIAEVFLGIGHSLLSGADTALLYESLVEKKNEKDYLKIEGRITALGNFSEALAGIFVSVFIFSAYRDYYYLQTVLAFIAFMASLFLAEPGKHLKSQKIIFKDILDIVVHTFRDNKKLRNIIVFSSVIGLASLSMAWMAQPVLAFVDFKESHFGYAWVILNTIVAIGSLSAKKINSLLGFKGSLIFMAIPLSLGFVFAGISVTTLAFVPLAILFFVRGTAHPILKKYINKLTESSQRATVFSLRSLLIRTMFFIVGIMLGNAYDKIGLGLALCLCGIIIFVPAVIVLVLILSKNGKSKGSDSNLQSIVGNENIIW